ncbi:MAG: glutamate--cysteine ligase [Pseudomonadota bacterium]|nr:glutamate--cysteine ligase [Pseudomonadota bacterium]
MMPSTPRTVPNMSAELRKPVLQIEALLLEKQSLIESWFRKHWLHTPPPFYASVDLRNAGFKLAPVDTNLFPAGFNNLDSSCHPLCIQAVQRAIERHCPTGRNILIVPESHTRNLYYLESLAALASIVERAGFDVRIGSLLTDLNGAQTIDLPSGNQVTLEPLERHGDRLSVNDFQPCMILLNNDLSKGNPAIFAGLQQPIQPPPVLGWTQRTKSGHFEIYREVAEEFADLVGMDPWLIDPFYRSCGRIDFLKREGLDCMAHNISSMLEMIGEKYRQYGIDKVPFVIVKADAGTYGMGIMTVTEPDDIYRLSRKQRTKMSSAKEGLSVDRVLIQEGVYTEETWGENGAVAEPVVYMIDNAVAGGFYRVHEERGPNENLNAPGMRFQPLAFGESCITPDKHLDPDAEPNRFYAYGVIARLALIAAARELATKT